MPPPRRSAPAKRDVATLTPLPATVLAWLHLFWLARSDVGEALIYGLIFAGLLLWRVRRAQLRAR